MDYLLRGLRRRRGPFNLKGQRGAITPPDYSTVGVRRSNGQIDFKNNLFFLIGGYFYIL
jgi:hypothetical protein